MVDYGVVLRLSAAATGHDGLGLLASDEVGRLWKAISCKALIWRVEER